MVYASNHGDPENWLEKYNLDMDWFRTMVNTLLNDRNGATPNGVANWAVQVGAFSIKQNADNYAAELHKKYGLNCYVIKK